MKHRVIKKENSNTLKIWLPYIENFLYSLVELSQNADLSMLRTHEQKIRETLEQQFSNKNGDDILIAIIAVIKKINLGIYSKEIKRQIKNEVKEKSEKDLRFNEIFSLVSEAEKKYSNVCFVVFFRTNPMEEFIKGCESYDLISDFENQKGEKAARNAIRIYREVAEMTYDNYVRILSELIELLEGKEVIKSHQSFGVLVSQLPKKLEKFGYFNLVDSNVGWLRNATCHGHWRYIPETDKIKLWDKTKPEKEFTSIELFKMAMNMHSMVSEIYMSIIPIYFKSKFFNEFFPLIKYVQKNFANLIEGSESHQSCAEKMLIDIFEPVTKIEFKRTNT
jgi:hypothetical protein